MGDEPEPRPARLAAPIEVLWAGLTVLGSLIVALILWRIVVADPDDREMVGAAWRLIRLVGLVGLGAVVLIGLLRVLRDYRMAEDEARMVVQDVLWTETRGEQRRNARWTAWRRRQMERNREVQR